MVEGVIAAPNGLHANDSIRDAVISIYGSKHLFMYLSLSLHSTVVWMGSADALELLTISRVNPATK
jgi:hypothetical protein